jgi:hypothetical protein
MSAILDITLTAPPFDLDSEFVIDPPINEVSKYLIVSGLEDPWDTLNGKYTRQPDGVDGRPQWYKMSRGLALGPCIVGRVGGWQLQEDVPGMGFTAVWLSPSEEYTGEFEADGISASVGTAIVSLDTTYFEKHGFIVRIRFFSGRKKRKAF